MSAILVAAVVIAIATLAGVAASEVASALSYRLFNATRDGAQYILRTLGGVVGFACGAAAVQTGNYVAALYGPPLALDDGSFPRLAWRRQTVRLHLPLRCLIWHKAHPRLVLFSYC